MLGRGSEASRRSASVFGTLFFSGDIDAGTIAMPEPSRQARKEGLMRNPAKKGPVVILAAGIICLGIATAQARDAAKGIIKYRRNVMKSHAAHIGAISSVVKGQVPYVDHVAVHASALQGTSKLILQLFPEGSGTGETRAKPEIWQQWSEFEQAAKRLQKETAKLVQLAESEDIKQMTPQFIAVGKACSGCHKAFRKRR